MACDQGEQLELGGRGVDTKWKEVNRLNKEVKSTDLDNRRPVRTEGEAVTKDVP